MLKVHGLFAILGAKTQKCVVYYFDKPQAAMHHFLAESATVLASSLRATYALTTPMGVYHHKFHEVQGKRPPPPKSRAKVVHEGMVLYPELYGTGSQCCTCVTCLSHHYSSLCGCC